MIACEGVGYDAARLTLVAAARAGRLDPKACRKFRRRMVDVLRVSPAIREVREEAVRIVQRGCGECRLCKGV